MKKIILTTTIMALAQSSFALSARSFCRSESITRTQSQLLNLISSSEALAIQTGPGDVSAISIDSASEDKLHAITTITFAGAEQNKVTYKLLVNCNAKRPVVELEALGQ